MEQDLLYISVWHVLLCIEVFVWCRYFDTERIMVSMGVTFTVLESSFQILLCTEGNGGITCGDMDKPLRFKRGDCIFIPAGVGRCSMLGQAELIKVRC